MKKKIKSMLLATLLPTVAFASGSKWSASWEFSYQDNSFATANQIEFQSQDAFLGGSITSNEGRGTYGLTMNAGPAKVGNGNFKGKAQKSYFNGTKKVRDNDFYIGFRLHNARDLTEKEIFGGAKIGKVYLNSAERTDDYRENKVYANLGGRILGLSNEQQGDASTTGAYYIKGDLGGQINFLPNNPGSKLLLRNILAKTGDYIIDESERLDIELGYGQATGKTASLGYNVQKDEGLLRRFSFALGYTEEGTDGTIIENRFTIENRNPLNFRLKFKPETNEANIGIDFTY